MVKMFIEGGGDSDLDIRCRKAFNALLQKMGYVGRMPKTVACGTRNNAYDKFKNEFLRQDGKNYYILIVDSEIAVSDMNQPWGHLMKHDLWDRPEGASDEQVFLMTTCMETWIAIDGNALCEFFGSCFNDNALPHQNDIEIRSPKFMLDSLERATKNCPKQYSKGRISYEILGKVNPQQLLQLAAFRRFKETLDGIL